MGKDLGTDNFRTFEREREFETCVVGTDIGVSMFEFEEMEFIFALPPPGNPNHYQY